MSNLPAAPIMLTQIKVGLFSIVVKEGILGTLKGKGG